MFEHHLKTMENLKRRFEEWDGVIALLIGGSVAHRFALENSDVDIMIIVSNEEHERRLRDRNIFYGNNEDTPYEGGYVDGKFMSIDFMRKTAECGNEPTRFAFEGAIVVFSKDPEVEELLPKIVRYDTAQKTDKIQRFYTQLEAGRWFYYEGKKRNNMFLMERAANNLILFAGRMILAHNETLFPYIKWMMRVLEGVPDKPADLMDNINALLKEKSDENIERLFQCVINFTAWPIEGISVADIFGTDVELTWLRGEASVENI